MAYQEKFKRDIIEELVNWVGSTKEFAEYKKIKLSTLNKWIANKRKG